MNAELFARIDDALRSSATALGLDAETLRVLEQTWKGFVRSGAKLDAAGKERLAAINEELASLGAQFGQNVLADEKDWALFLDEADLAGLPDFLEERDGARPPRSRGQKGRYAVTLSRSIYEPFTTFSDRRDLREKAFRAFTMRGENGGATDNRDVVREDAGAARREGEAARLRQLCRAEARRHHGQDAEGGVRPARSGLGQGARKGRPTTRPSCSALAAAAGSNEPIAGWDWRYYQEKLRAEKFAFDEAELKPYLQLERVIDACFDVATRLFGISFEEREGIAAWHPDVRVFEVLQRRRQRIAARSSPTISPRPRSAPAPG